MGGDLYLWSYGDDPPPNCPAGVVRAHVGPEICRVESSAFHWRAVLDSLEAHRVWTLPLEEPEKIGFDGWYLVVETWNEGVYRTYDYWYPQADDGPAGRDAQAIMNLLWDLSPRVGISLPAGNAHSRRGEAIRAVIGALAGALIANPAYCLPQESDCGAEFEPIALGLLIGGFLGAGFGSAADD